jgi:hypothetical protein
VNKRPYSPVLTATLNGKGVLDVDTVRGCTAGLSRYPNGGCYGECYAVRGCARSGVDFSVSVSRRPTVKTWPAVFSTVERHPLQWYRVGVMGDPCHDWDNTVSVCLALKRTRKTPVIVTKHWHALMDGHIDVLRGLGAVFNTSVSGMDTDNEIRHRLTQFRRLGGFGVRSLLRVVTCRYGGSDWAKRCNDEQRKLLSVSPIIDNPLRPSKHNPRVLSGDILISPSDPGTVGGRYVSLHSKDVYLGTCTACPDQCGASKPLPTTSNQGQLLWHENK